MENKKKYSVSVRVGVILNKIVLAENLEEALEKAKELKLVDVDYRTDCPIDLDMTIEGVYTVGANRGDPING